MHSSIGSRSDSGITGGGSGLWRFAASRRSPGSSGCIRRRARSDTPRSRSAGGSRLRSGARLRTRGRTGRAAVRFRAPAARGDRVVHVRREREIATRDDQDRHDTQRRGRFRSSPAPRDVSTLTPRAVSDHGSRVCLTPGPAAPNMTGRSAIRAKERLVVISVLCLETGIPRLKDGVCMSGVAP